MICPDCFTTYQLEDEFSCPGCGSAKRAPIPRVEEQNADFLGFTAARQKHESSGWTQAGSLVKPDQIAAAKALPSAS